VGKPPIKVLIVDDMAETRESLKKLLGFHGGFVVTGEAMAAGARGYLVKPFSADELVSTIRRTHDMEIQRRAQLMPSIPLQGKLGRIISIYSAKGGVGKTTIAVNLAAELGKERDRKVVLVDLDLQFGDVAIMLDTSPVRTIADIAREEEVDSETVEACLLKHNTGISVLASPLRPEQGETVAGRHVLAILKLLAESYDFVIVDLAQRLDDISLAGLDMADIILLVASTDLPSIKNAKASIEIMESLGYESKMIKLALSRPSREHGLDISEIEKTLKRKVDVQIPNEERVVFPSVNKGAPFTISSPTAKVSVAIRELAKIISPPGKEDAVAKRGFGRGKPGPRKRTAGILAWIFSMFLNG
jgi:pilus assembly protein CpaE